MLTAEAKMHRGSSGRRIYVTPTSQGSASSPNGLRTPPWFSNGPGASPSVTLDSKITTAEKRANVRHLLEGSFPSGNSKTRYIPSSPIVGTHSHWLPIVPIATGKGTEPGLAVP